MKFYRIAIIFLFCLTPILAFSRDCGENTSESPASASTSEYIGGGALKSLRGRVLFPNGEKAEQIIVEVYRNHLTIPVSKITYVEAGEILKTKRIAAKDTGLGARFCFKNMKAGNYMLRINSRGSNSQFSTMYVFVTLAADRKRKEKPELQVRLEFAI